MLTNVGRGIELTPTNPITVNNKHENNLILRNRACCTLDSELMPKPQQATFLYTERSSFKGHDSHGNDVRQ